MSNAEYIITHLSESELLAQLAEEASELTQASLKLRRVLDGTNPTPVTEEEARMNLEEEEMDVLCCISLIGYRDDTHHLNMMDRDFHKLERWRKRLEGMQ